MGCDGHALEQTERISLHQHSIGKGAAVALIRVDADVFVSRRIHRLPFVASRSLLGYRAPFDASREPGTAATAQAGRKHLLHHGRRGHSQGSAQPRHTAMGDKIIGVQWVNHPHTLVYPPVLAGQKINLFNLTQIGGICCCRRPAGHILCLDVTPANTDAVPRWGALDQGFQPQQATAARSHDLKSLGGKDIGHPIRPHRASRRVTGHEPNAHDDSPLRAAATAPTSA